MMLDGVGQSLERYMDLLSTRQKLVASNVANSETPGYKAKDIDFHFEFLSRAEPGEARVIEAQGLKTKNDGNNVSIDREARLLAENSIRFNVASQLMKSQIRVLRSAIQDGKP